MSANPFTLHPFLREIAPSPSPMYAGCEQMRGRLRAPVDSDLFAAIRSRDDHDDGDADRGDS